MTYVVYLQGPHDGIGAVSARFRWAWVAHLYARILVWETGFRSTVWVRAVP